MSRLTKEWKMPQTGAFMDATKLPQPVSKEAAPDAAPTKSRAKSSQSAGASVPKRTAAKRTKASASTLNAVDVTPASLAAVALFKGIHPSNLATAIGIPTSTVLAFFNGKQVSLRAETKRNLADYLGVDWKNGRLRSGQVHIFQLGYIGYLSSKQTFQSNMVALGALINKSSAAAINFANANIFRRMTTPEMHVIQNHHIRAIFVSCKRASYNARFSPEYFSECSWIGHDESKSKAGIYQPEMEVMLRDLDVTPVDFDEIFLGKKALSWADVQTTSREHQVSKLELVQWIKTVGANRKGKALDKTLRVINGKIEQENVDQAGTSEYAPNVNTTSTFLPTGTN